MPIKIIKRAAASAPPPVPVKAATEKKVSGRVLDGMYAVVRETSPNAVVPWFLIASYLYYIHDLSILSDGLYDAMAKEMQRDWDQIEHVHKHLITKGDLDAGSLYRLKASDYPGSVRGAARHLVAGEWGERIDDMRDCPPLRACNGG